jgi:CHAT domain-containing protein
MRVSLLPSASVYRVLLQHTILERPPRLLSIGDPAYSLPAPRLRSAAVEAETIADVFDDAALLGGDQATEARIVAAMPDHTILHFATHGVLLGHELPGASSLLVAADNEHDGMLNALEIAALDLRATDLAVLSACRSSVSESEQGTLDLASLGGAFLAAGVASVIGTLWQVDDRSTTLLMVDFYRRFLETGPGEALRAAQLALRRQPRFRHPYYWAPFVLYGVDK